MRARATAEWRSYRAAVREAFFTRRAGSSLADLESTATDKANFPHPHGLAVNEAWHQHVTEVHAKAGDVVIFCEAYESCTVSMMHLQKQQLSAQN